MKRVFWILVLAGTALAGVPGQKYLPESVKLAPEQAGKGATVGLKGAPARKYGIHDGNKIRLKFFNHGAICGPNRVDPWPRLEWPAYSGHEYLYEIGPMIGARVKGYNPATGDSVWISIVDDPIQDGGDEDFEPVPGFARDGQPMLAFSNRPETWPEVWPPYTNVYGDTVKNLRGKWAGAYNEVVSPDSVIEVIRGDQESFFVMSDSFNLDFRPGNPEGNPIYLPYADNDQVSGLGLLVKVRGYQWAASVVEDLIIFTYEITNISDYDLDSMVVGYFGDYRIGGPGSDFSDDMYAFDAENNMVIVYDQDGMGFGADGRPYQCGMLGFRLLETPKDENGQELGLTSVYSFPYGTAGLFAYNDSAMYNLLRPGVYDVNPGPGDYITVFGSGYFRLARGETQRFSIAIVMGEDSADLYDNARFAQIIYDRDYQFPKAPPPPRVMAVPDRYRVTLFWDDSPESAEGFEGYLVYRSEDGGASWGDPVTDALGRLVWYKPLAQYDKADGVTGYAPIGVNGVHFYLGDDSGLRHSFVDSTVTPGKTYWYAVLSYNQGDTSLLVPPMMSSLYPIENNPAIVKVIPTAPPLGMTEPAVVLDSSRSTLVTTSLFEARIANPYDLADADYQITIQYDSTGTDTTWTITRLQNGEGTVLASGIPYIHGEDGAPIVDGLRFFITSETREGLDTLVWSPGNSNLYVDQASVFRWLPYHVMIEIGEPDTAARYKSTGPYVNNVPMKFRVSLVQGDQILPAEFMYQEADGDSLVDDPYGNDRLSIFAPGGTTPLYQIIFKYPFVADTDSVYIPPQAGDVAHLRFYTPLSPADTVLFTVTAPRTSEETIQSQLDQVAVVPNPYVVAARWEIKDEYIRFGRGERELHFINLPEEAVIRIYTINGELIRTLRHFPGEDGYLSPSVHAWNLQNKYGQEIAYGLYVYHVEGYVDGKRVGSAIGKFAVIK